MAAVDARAWVDARRGAKALSRPSTNTFTQVRSLRPRGAPGGLKCDGSPVRSLLLSAVRRRHLAFGSETVSARSRARSVKSHAHAKQSAESDRTVEMRRNRLAARGAFRQSLSEEECDALISMSRDKVQPSSVVNVNTGAYDIHPHRTSAGTYFQRGENELLQRIERRIAELVDCPVEQGEPIQVLHYGAGGEYRPHYDYFDPAHAGNRALPTAAAYRDLDHVPERVIAGGSTVFPEVGLDVLPRKGNAVYFAYCDDDGQLDTRTLHGGSPVSEGEKWIATKWFRQRAYGGLGA